MNKTLSVLILMTAAMTSAFAQGTTPEQKGEVLTFDQLATTYAKSLLNVHFDENGVLQYVKPEDAKDAAAMLPKGPRGQKGIPSADGEWRAVNEGNRLKVVKSQAYNDGVAMTLEMPVEFEVSDNSEGDIVWGQSVHRNEFGINGGIFWSPNGHQLAFYRMDETMVQSYPLVQSDDREATVKWVKYPMAGMTSHQVTVGIYNPDTQKTVYLKTNEKPTVLNGEQLIGTQKGLNDPEHYLTNISWRPDGKQIFIFELNRLQNYMELNAYDVESGCYLYTLYTQESEKYVEPENPLYFLPGSNDKFIMQSKESGYNHLWLCEIKENVVKKPHLIHTAVSCPRMPLTSGDWMVTNLIGVDPKCKAVYYSATKDSPLESNVYKTELPAKVVSGKWSPKEPVRLTAESGRHNVMFNKDYTQFYDTYTNHDTPRVCQLCTIKGNKVTGKVLYTAEDPWKGFARPEVTVGMTKAADGKTDLYYRVVKPTNMEEGKKYPAVVYLYNGPHTQLITDGYQWGLPAWDCFMASHGYVVFTIDGRGSSNRGLEFEQTIWHNLGYNEGLDQMKGIEVLTSLPFVDANRIGIYGWSYGGFMTTYMILNYPETFKVGVCGGPVLDWSRYEVMYGERYMGTPQNNPEGYARNRMIDQAGKLKGKLLIIHDDQDDTVVPQMSYQFLKNSVKEGTYPDFMLYINHPHNVRGKDRNHLNTRIAQYFFDNL